MIPEIAQLNPSENFRLTVDNLEYWWSDHGPRTCVNVENFRIGVGKIIGLVGPSGSGKSTLIRCFLGLPPRGLTCEGNISLLGTAFKPFENSSELQNTRKALAYVCQNPYSGFVPHMKISDQIRHLLKCRGLSRNLFQVTTLLTELGFTSPEKFLSRTPSQLSGGQLQRLQLVTALSTDPKLIFADEISASLDDANRDRVANMLIKYRDNSHTSMLLASHDHQLISTVCDYTYQIKDRTVTLS